MLFNAQKPTDILKAKTRFNYLIENGKRFEIIVKHPRRTISQNSYLHLLFSWFALQTGYTESEVKQYIFKQVVNSDIFYDGEVGTLVKIERWRSTADLTTAELTKAIERFRNYSSTEAGIYLPEPSDLIHLQEIEEEIKNYSNQLYL